MKNKIKLASLFLCGILLVGCSGNNVVKDNSHVSVDLGSEEKTSNNQEASNSSENLNAVYRTCLTLDGKVFIPTSDITVIWENDRYTKSMVIGNDGYASTNELDGDFNVHLLNLPDGYSYNPNIYKVDNDNPYCEIELIPLLEPKSGTGADNYDKVYKMSKVGTYRATFKNSKVTTVYFEFAPTEAGIYSVESLVDCYEDMVNPGVEIYTGSSAYKRLMETKDSGGTYIKGGFTKNFKWEDEFDQSNIAVGGGAVIAFGITAESKTGEYPLHIDFTLKYVDYYEYDKINRKTMVAKEANFKTPDYDKTKYSLVNTDGGSGNYYESAGSNKLILLDGSKYAYDPEDGYYRLYDSKTKTYGERMVAYITKPCPYYEESLNKIESHGNKNLTVESGTENYKTFIEEDYAAACNSDGVCYVTKELKEFLQKFSVSQRLFMDGYGVIEDMGRYAKEEDQWLFCCAYYKAK